jgi:hypothetical protein
MSKSRGDTILGKIVNKKECLPKLARKKYPEQTSCSTSTKTSPIEKREPQGNVLTTRASVSIQAVELFQNEIILSL